jgi:cell division control protein 6
LDQAVKKISDNFLYNLTRLNSELGKAQISLVGISNDLRFLDNLDPRVRSSLSEEELIFSPYNAIQLQDILKERAQQAFHKNSIDEGVIEKCAAYAAREHGDARRALDLLRVAGEMAAREGNNKIKLKHIDVANNKIERDKILDVVESEPRQFQLVLLSILNLTKNEEKVFTGDVYTEYQNICNKIKMDILTQRRVSSIISEFDMLGLINARNISRGSYGKTREIRSAIPKEIFKQARNILENALAL